jgi:trk system potassium uptake protein TrkA
MMRVLFAGDGRRLEYLAACFSERGHEVTAIAVDRAECERLALRSSIAVICGDPSDPLVLEEAGARRADVFLAATTSDSDNLIACQMARLRYGVPRTIALVNDPDNETVFRTLGVEAFSTGRTVASLVEQRTSLETVTDLFPVENAGARILEVLLPAGAPVVGRTLAECPLPEEALVAVVTRDGSTLIPKGATELHAGDRLLVVALTRSLPNALRALTGRG